jgi:hypothetical protein
MSDPGPSKLEQQQPATEAQIQERWKRHWWWTRGLAVVGTAGPQPADSGPGHPGDRGGGAVRASRGGSRGRGCRYRRILVASCELLAILRASREFIGGIVMAARDVPSGVRKKLDDAIRDFNSANNPRDFKMWYDAQPDAEQEYIRRAVDGYPELRRAIQDNNS